MDTLKRLNDAVAYLEAHLEEPIDEEALGRITLVSPDSFARFFSYMTGMSLKTYVARRRLTLAAYELQRTRQRVIDVAVKYGYGSADAFARAFARQHGVTPSRARERGIGLHVYPPVSFHITIEGASKMNVRIEKRDPMTLWGISKTFTGPAEARFDQEHEMWDDDHDAVTKRISPVTMGTWYGIWDAGRYTVARIREDVTEDGLETVIVPGGTYAVFTTEKGGFAGSELPRLRQEIMGAWLKDAGYEQAADYEVEVYHLFPRERRQERYYELWVPVK